MNPSGRRTAGYNVADWWAEPAERIRKVDMRKEDGTPYSFDETPAARALRGETVRGEIVRISTVAGEELWLSTSAVPVVTNSGERIGAVGVFQDISAVKRAERDLLRMHESLRMLAAASRTVMATTDVGETLQAIAEAALSVAGGRQAACGHGFVTGRYIVGGSAALVNSERLGEAVLRVRDTGSGIPSHILSRIFEPFTQAETTLDRNKGGLGLGLALVKGFVEMHGGTVSVESEGMGRGAEFTVLLPLAGRPARVAEPHAPAPRAQRTRRVLVIEDNPDAAESLRDVLELSRHTVELAYSGFSGIEKARTFGPDVVLCDIGLPGMDGYEVAKALRHDPELRSVKLVALTGYAAPDDIAKAQEAGFDDHLAKPPSFEQLEGVLAKVRP